MRQTILVTGGRGFIGSAIVQLLIQDSENVVFSVDRRPPILINSSAFLHEVIMDSCNHADLIHLARKADVVINVAGLSVNYHAEPEVVRTNVLGSTVAVRAARASRSGYLLHVSSSAVYGPAIVPSLAREDQPLAPVGVYADSKAQGERAVGMAFERGDVHGLIVRPFTVVGPGQRSPARATPPVLPGLIHSALSGTDFVVNGLGTHLRDYIGVADVAGCIVQAVKGLRASHVPVNLGSGVAISLFDLAGLVQQILRKTIPFRIDESRGLGQDAFAANIDRMHALFNWKLQPLHAVVESTVLWCTRTMADQVPASGQSLGQDFHG